jgi:hypothetical protein
MRDIKRIIFIVAFWLTNITLLFFNLTKYIAIDLLLFVDLLVILALLYYHIKYNRESLMLSSFIVFNWLFFFLAPLLQIKRVTQIGTLPNTMSFDYSLIILGLSAIIIFNLLFIIFYFSLQKYFKIKVKALEYVRYNRATFFVLILLSIFVAFFFSTELLIMIKSEVLRVELSLAYNLILRKVLLSMIIASVLYYIIKIKHKKYAFISILLLLFSFMILLIFKNPLLEKRNALGVIYLMIMYFSMPKLFSSNLRSFSLISASLLIVFPLSYFATHWRTISSKESFRLDVIFDNFYQLHYDAFSNLLASISYVFDYGITYGNQLLGGFLFFIPRTFWEGKPLNSGKMIGRYMMQNHSMWFDNLSMPFIGESILNFGVLGIGIFAFSLALIILFFEKLYFSNDFLIKSVAVYFSFHIIFLMRGDFTNAYAYFIGTIIGFFVIPKLINKIFNIRLV